MMNDRWACLISDVSSSDLFGATEVKPDGLAPRSHARTLARQTVREPSPSDQPTLEPRSRRHGGLSIRRLPSGSHPADPATLSGRMPGAPEQA